MVAVRFGRHEGFVRVVLDTTVAADHSVSLSDDGKAVTIALPRTQWRAAPSGKADGAPPLTMYDVKQASGEARLLLRAARPVTVRFVSRFLPSGAAGHRLVIDLAEK